MQDKIKEEQAIKLCTACHSPISAGICLACLRDDEMLELSYSDPWIGKTINERYRIDALLGQGGWGAVYKAMDLQLDRIVAVKILHQHWVLEKDKLKRFQREAKSLSQVLHSSLVAVFDYGLLPQPYMVLEFVEGDNLEHLVHITPLKPHEAADMFAHICEGLQVLHNRGFVHRDIKPSNIVVDSKTNLPKLLDLGLVKLGVTPQASAATETGRTVGTPLYMSPEQCQGYPVDQRSDIYSLGCALFEGLTGKPPFDSINPLDTMYRQLHEEPPALKTFALDSSQPGIADLEKILRRCMAKSPDDRYQSCDELRKDLCAYSQGLPVTARPAAARRAGKLGQIGALSEGRRIMIGLLASAVIAGLLVAGFARLLPQTTGRHTSPAIGAGDADGMQDAAQLDSMALKYFSQGDYKRAIPLLEFGIRTYKENGTRMGRGAEDTYLADQEQHIGKCYVNLQQPTKAVPYYRDALRLYKKFGNYRGSFMSQAVNDYATTLRTIGKTRQADAMEDEFRRTNNITTIP